MDCPFSRGSWKFLFFLFLLILVIECHLNFELFEVLKNSMLRPLLFHHMCARWWPKPNQLFNRYGPMTCRWRISRYKYLFVHLYVHQNESIFKHLWNIKKLKNVWMSSCGSFDNKNESNFIQFMNPIQMNSESVSISCNAQWPFWIGTQKFGRNLSWLMQQWAAVKTKRRWTTVPPHRNESFSPLSNCFFVLNLSLTRYGQLSSIAFTPLHDFRLFLSKSRSKMVIFFLDIQTIFRNLTF